LDLNLNKNIRLFNGSESLVKALDVTFCKNGEFNYDKYPSYECINAEKTGREGFEGCSSKFRKSNF
jgi:hypothetical protein